ncbi:MAG: AIM24 family protein, partial [Patescibacteria group bacterium]
MVRKRILKSGETIKLDTGCIVGFTGGVDYDIKFTGGFRNTLFGGEGLFLATLKGPGTVYYQTLPLARLASRIANSGGFGQGEQGGIASDILGGIISGGN